jgi:Sodium Bile acid symporter family
MGGSRALHWQTTLLSLRQHWALLLLFHASPMIAVGILVAAVCSRAPYGPPFTAMAKGKLEVAVGLMVILAGSSAIVAPLLLQFLLPIVARDIPLKINLIKIVGTLLGAQLLPLCVGLIVRQRWRQSGDREQQLPRYPGRGLGNRVCVVSDDCGRIGCFGLGPTYASRQRLGEAESRMNKDRPTYLARYGETAWNPTGQPYWADLSTEASEQLARRVGSGLQRHESHQVDASGMKPSTKRKKQSPGTMSIP